MNAAEHLAGAVGVVDLDRQRGLAHQRLALERDRALLAQRDDGDARPHLRQLDEAALHVRRMRELGGEAFVADHDVGEIEQLTMPLPRRRASSSTVTPAARAPLGGGDVRRRVAAVDQQDARAVEQRRGSSRDPARSCCRA